jgi:hypothetical protein
MANGPASFKYKSILYRAETVQLILFSRYQFSQAQHENRRVVEVDCFLTRHSAKKESPKITGELSSAHTLFASLQLLTRFAHPQTGNLAPSTIHTRKAPVPRFSPECHLLLHAPRRCSAPLLRPYHAKNNKREVIRDHDVDMAYQDEKLNVDKQGGATEISASDAALTRRILLKLDLRYFPAHLSLSFIKYFI